MLVVVIAVFFEFLVGHGVNRLVLVMGCVGNCLIYSYMVDSDRSSLSSMMVQPANTDPTGFSRYKKPTQHRIDLENTKNEVINHENRRTNEDKKTEYKKLRT